MSHKMSPEGSMIMENVAGESLVTSLNGLFANTMIENLQKRCERDEQEKATDKRDRNSVDWDRIRW